jgi:transposase
LTLNIAAELGADMSRFPDDTHVAAWGGVAPGNNESAGKHYSGRTTKGSPALRRVLIQAAWAAVRTHNTYLSALYHRLAARRGKKRAIVAVAHSILVSAYHMALRGEVYQELGRNYFDERQKETIIMRLSRRLEKLGFTVKPTPQAAAA